LIKGAFPPKAAQFLPDDGIPIDPIEENVRSAFHPLLLDR